MVRFSPWKNEHGFSLIELLVVAAIIVMLSVSAMPVYAKVTGNVRYSKSQEDLRVIETALERYQADNGHYPSRLGVLVAKGYLKPTALESPWSSSSNRIYYFYAVDVSGENAANSYGLGDPGSKAVCGSGLAIRRHVVIYPQGGGIPCGRNPFKDTDAAFRLYVYTTPVENYPDWPSVILCTDPFDQANYQDTQPTCSQSADDFVGFRLHGSDSETDPTRILRANG